MHHAAVAGVGHYVPARVVTNQELTTYMDTSDAWIQERTGIQERRWYSPGHDTVAGMGAAAGCAAGARVVAETALFPASASRAPRIV
jgi:3-oxoacyl-[acyl-carrier-protein] synthase III